MTDSATPQFSQENISQLLSQHYQLPGKLKQLPGYCDQNLLLTTANQQYIVKIANTAEPLIELEMQNAAMAHLSRKGIAVPHALNNRQGQAITAITSPLDRVFYLRVLTYLPGNFYADAPVETHSPELWQNLGQFLGQLDLGCADFEHPGAYRYLAWDLAQGYRICQSKKHLLNPLQSSRVDYFLTLYQTQTMPLLGTLPQGVIHNDANDYNLLVDDVNQPIRISGLIDFGDMVHTHIVNELAIACAYAMMGQNEPLTVMKQVAAAYHRVRPLTDAEIEVLFSLVALRLCTTVCNSALAISQQPDNQYLLVSVKPASDLLAKLSRLNVFSAQCQLRQACQLPLDSGKRNQQIISNGT